jgi:hypothetical protein
MEQISNFEQFQIWTIFWILTYFKIEQILNGTDLEIKQFFGFETDFWIWTYFWMEQILNFE